MLAPSASMTDRIALYNDNALKIGLFGVNCSSSRTATTVPERWSASWPDCLALARLADAIRGAALGQRERGNEHGGGDPRQPRAAGSNLRPSRHRFIADHHKLLVGNATR